MTTLPGADIRGYYQALGIELPGWASRDASVRCFADPDAHQHEDRNPSCSVSLESGAWYCHGCGAHGGAYDAALTKGHTPRAAIDLMISHGLTERRPQSNDTGVATTRPQHTRSEMRPPVPVSATSRSPRFAIAERDVERWQQALARRPMLVAALTDQRGWSYPVIRELGLGLDQPAGRITIPIRDHAGRLQGLLRYQPLEPRYGPKTRAALGTRLGLMPHPATLPDREVVLCEGPADMIAARSHGLPAIATPSTSGWRAEWADHLNGCSVTVVMDSDPPGRHAATQIIRDLSAAGITARAIDLAPGRADGYDLTDWLADQRHTVVPCALRPRPLRVATNAGSGREPIPPGPGLVHLATDRTPLSNVRAIRRSL
jgi:Toprim domain